MAEAFGAAGPKDHPGWGSRPVQVRDRKRNLFELRSPRVRESRSDDLQREGDGNRSRFDSPDR